MSRFLRSLNVNTFPRCFRSAHSTPLHAIKDDVLKRRTKSIFKAPLKQQMVDTNKQLQELRRLSLEVRALLKQRAVQAREELLKQELNFSSAEERSGHLLESEAQSEAIYALMSENTDPLEKEAAHPVLANGEPGPTGAAVTAAAADLFAFPEKLHMPAAVIAKFGSEIKYLTGTRKQDWRKVLAFLKLDRNGFSDLSVEDVNVLISRIPAAQRVALIPHLTHMLALANHVADASTHLLFMDAFASTRDLQGTIQHWEANKPQLLAAGPVVATKAYGILTKAHGKHLDLALMNAQIVEMQTHGLEPSREIYTNVMQVCIALKDYDGAMDLFRMLKFLGEATRPDVVAYTSVIMMHVQRNDVEQALDIYAELDEGLHNTQLVNRTKKQRHIGQAEPIRPSVAMLNALAHGCARRPEYRLKGWNFIFQINSMGYEPDGPTMEAMMHLSARDGDLDLTRALFFKLAEANTVTRVAVNYLMLAYFKYDFKKTIHEKVRPAIELHDLGAIFRENVISYFLRSMRGYLELTPEERQSRFTPPPFLPLCGFQSYEQTVKESGALWAYLTLLKPETLSIQAVGSYLLAAQRKGSNTEFRRRFDECTYLERDGTSSTVVVEEPEPEAAEPASDASVTEPAALHQARQSQVKFPRNHHIYNIALQTASVNESINLAQRIWVERGEWRKTIGFQSQPKAVRMTQDFDFARNMVLTFSNLGLLNEALIIVKSTMKQFKWEFHQLAPLYQKALQYGNEYVAETVSDICNEHKPKLKRFHAYIKKAENA